MHRELMLVHPHQPHIPTKVTLHPTLTIKCIPYTPTPPDAFHLSNQFALHAMYHTNNILIYCTITLYTAM